jgi:hypothetical protein
VTVADPVRPVEPIRAAPEPAPAAAPEPAAAPPRTPAPQPSASPFIYAPTTDTVVVPEPERVSAPEAPTAAAAAAPPPQAVPLPVGVGKPTTIYLNLVGEGIACLRSVQAEHLGRDYYRIVEEQPSGESWEFGPGQVVRCRKQKLSNGKALVAFEEAQRAN